MARKRPAKKATCEATKRRAPSRCERPLLQAASIGHGHKGLHQPSAPAFCTSPLHQPFAPAAETFETFKVGFPKPLEFSKAGAATAPSTPRRRPATSKAAKRTNAPVDRDLDPPLELYCWVGGRTPWPAHIPNSARVTVAGASAPRSSRTILAPPPPAPGASSLALAGAHGPVPHEPAYARFVAYTAGIVRRGAKWHAAVNLKLFEVQARVEIQGTPQPEYPMMQVFIRTHPQR